AGSSSCSVRSRVRLPSVHGRDLYPPPALTSLVMLRVAAVRGRFGEVTGAGRRPLTLTLGEPAHSPCRVGSARRRGSQRGRDQHRGVRTADAPVAEGTAPLRRARGAGAFARRSGVRLSLLRPGPARTG